MTWGLSFHWHVLLLIVFSTVFQSIDWCIDNVGGAWLNHPAANQNKRHPNGLQVWLVADRNRNRQVSFKLVWHIQLERIVVSLNVEMYLFYPQALCHLLRHAWDTVTVDLFYHHTLSHRIRHAWDTVDLFYPGSLVTSYNMSGLQWTYSIPGP